MTRSRFCRICKDFHDLDQSWPADCYGHFGARGESAGFYVQSDTIAPIQSMADGQMYDSKSRYRETLKQRGLIEVGNERVEQKPAPAAPVGDALRQAWHQLGG